MEQTFQARSQSAASAVHTESLENLEVLHLKRRAQSKVGIRSDGHRTGRWGLLLRLLLEHRRVIYVRSRRLIPMQRIVISSGYGRTFPHPPDAKMTLMLFFQLGQPPKKPGGNSKEQVLNSSTDSFPALWTGYPMHPR